MSSDIRTKYETTVELHDGRQVGSWSEEWKLECEARYLLRMPLTERRAALEKREQIRGAAAVLKLKDRMASIHRARVVAKASSGQ